MVLEATTGDSENFTVAAAVVFVGIESLTEVTFHAATKASALANFPAMAVFADTGFPDTADLNMAELDIDRLT